MGSYVEQTSNVPVVINTSSVNNAEKAEKEVVAVLLLPPASTPQKRATFLNTLSTAGITPYSIINRGVELRDDKQYSFTGMRDDLLAVLTELREKKPDAKIVVSASCLSTISLALALQEIQKRNLVDGIIAGIPVSSLQTVADAHQSNLSGLQNLYDQYYKLKIDLNGVEEYINLSVIQQLALYQSTNSSWKPFIYFNKHSKYITEEDYDLYVQGVIDGIFDGMILKPGNNDKNPIGHDLDVGDVPAVQTLTIDYMRS